MKKLLLFLIIALFTLTTVKTNTETDTYVDFDDIEYPEVVKV